MFILYVWLDDNVDILLVVYWVSVVELEKGCVVVFVVEWLLDNYYLVEE